MNWIFDKDVNTDLITPGRYNISTDPEELRKIVFIEERPEFHERVSPGDFVIAGTNFGYGSSRETAASALRATGIRAVVAKSFARIFYRNAANVGLLVVKADTTGIGEADVLVLDLKNDTLVNQTAGWSRLVDVPPLVKKMHEVGGIIPFLQSAAAGGQSVQQAISLLVGETPHAE